MITVAQSLDTPWVVGRWIERSDGRFAIVAVCGVLLSAGVMEGSMLMVGAASAGLCLLTRMLEQHAFAPHGDRVWKLASLLLEKCGRYGVSGAVPPEEPEEGPSKIASDPAPVTLPDTIESTDDLVDAMLATHRYALLLRSESATHLSIEQRRSVVAALEEQMSLIPAGPVLTGVAAERATLGDEAEAEPSIDDAVSVDTAYLNRRPVTNAEYQQFVDAGGYEEPDLWLESALPALFEFIDQTGDPGPRYWSEGRHQPEEDRLPVVGVSWHEACAYARWVGKRLPSDAEWTKACAWPIESAPGQITQRRYPWGESFEAHRANLWVAGRRGLAAVDEFPEGTAIGGLQQMIGNVWEWCDTPLDDATPAGVGLPAALRCVRGGAFNTYFENQATCHYQSADHPLARRPNVGFRLALSMDSLDTALLNTAEPGG